MNKIFLICIFLFSCLSSSAQWAQSNGPYGGYIRALAVNGNKIFAGTYYNGIFSSTNNGGSWSRSYYGSSSGELVSCFAISGINIYAGTGISGVLISANNGGNWVQSNSGLTDPRIQCIAANGSNIFVGTPSGIFRSTNSGSSWAASNGGITNTQIISLAVSGTNIFAGTQGGGIFVSSNNGNTWVAANNGLTNNTVNCITCIGSTIFAGTNNGVFSSNNNGGNWTTSGLTNNIISSFVVNATNIFAGAFGRTYLSTNNGTTWTLGYTGLPYTRVAAMAINAGNILAGLEGGGFYLSSNNGNTWSPANNGLVNTDIRSIHSVGSNTFAGAYLDGVFLSTDSGNTWVAKNNGLLNSSPEIVAITSLGAKIFAAGSGIYLSTDTGNNWSPIYNGISSFVSCLATKGNNVFAGTDAGVFIYNSATSNWTPLNNGLNNQQVNCMAVDSNNIFIGTGGGVYKSIDNGNSWSPMDTTFSNLYITSISVSDSDIYIGSYSGAFRSIDYGSSWSPASYVPYVFLGNSKIIGVGTGGLFYSADNGSNWAWINNGITGLYNVSSVGLCGNNILAGSAFEGVWKKAVPISQPFNLGTTSASIVNATCGQNNGSISGIAISGGIPPYAVQWQDSSGAIVGNSMQLQSVGAGTYYFKVVDASGLTTDTLFIINGTNLVDSTTISIDKTIICANDSAQICALSGYTNYLWNTGAATQCIYASNAGNYYLTATESNGCIALSNHLALNVYSLPTVSITVNGDTLTSYNAVNFQWLLNGNEISGANASEYVADEAGSYSVVVTDSNGCTAISNPIIISGINELDDNNKITVYPNPAASELIIKVSSQVQSIRIYTVSGKLLKEATPVAGKNIDISHLTAGIYMAEVKLNNTIQRVRWVKL